VLRRRLDELAEESAQLLARIDRLAPVRKRRT